MKAQRRWIKRVLQVSSQTEIVLPWTRRDQQDRAAA